MNAHVYTYDIAYDIHCIPQIATPVSKQIKVDRRSSFLDKLCHEVEEEEEKKRKKSRNIKGYLENI